MRDLGVRMKLTPIREVLDGKRVVMVDDSIVRGTTTGKVVRLLLDAGAKSVHVRISARPFAIPAFTASIWRPRTSLIAAHQSVEAIRQHIGATSLGLPVQRRPVPRPRRAERQLLPRLLHWRLSHSDSAARPRRRSSPSSFRWTARSARRRQQPRRHRRQPSGRVGNDSNYDFGCGTDLPPLFRATSPPLPALPSGEGESKRFGHYRMR